jgi:multiple sugar transport system ATP-binding protein
MVFQDYALYPHLTAYQNIEFPLRVTGVPKEERAKRVKEVMEFLDISRLAERKPRYLSGGERQRVALGRAIIRRPQVFLMDEPLANIDAKIRLQMRSELKILQRTLGITTIYVTHDQEEALSIADKVAIMCRGNLMQMAVPTEIYSKPTNHFVAGFVGSPPMNFFEGKILKDNSANYLLYGSIRMELPSGIDLSASPEVIVGVRPRDFDIEKRSVPDYYQVQVIVAEHLGSRQHITCQFETQKIKIETDEDFEVGMNGNLWVKPRLDHIHIFDSKTGNRIQ